MKSICITVLAACLLSPAAFAQGGVGDAAKPVAKRFNHDGYGYRYVTFSRDGAQIIRGQREDGAKFRYVVRGDTVRGKVDGAPVQFGLDDVPRMSR